EWSMLHANREELRTAACVLTECRVRAVPVGASREPCLRERAHITDAVLNLPEDVHSIKNALITQSGGQYPSNITPSENQEPSVLQSAPNTTADGCASREGQPSPHSPEGMCNESMVVSQRGKGKRGLPDPSSTSSSAPLHLAKLVTCKVADGLGSLTVSGSEELASVLGIEISSSTTHPFPFTVALPFRLCRHSRYREATVKVVAREQQGSFVVVRVHTLGVFAVLFRLQKEILTIPKRGLSLGLRMYPTIGLDYLRGSFTTSVVAQVKPVATTLRSMLKCRNESYLSINTSPLPYLSHPSTLNPRQPLTLPLPPNPEEGRRGGCPPDAHHPLAPSGQVEEFQGYSDGMAILNIAKTQVLAVVAQWLRVWSASLKSSKELAKEQLAVLRWRDEQWNVLDKVSVRNLQNSLVSFEVMENYERYVLNVLNAFSHAMDSGDQDTVPHTITFHNQRRNTLYLQLEELDPFGNYSSPHYKGTAVLFRVPRHQLVWRGDRAVISEDYSSEEPVCKLSLTLPKVACGARKSTLQTASRKKEGRNGQILSRECWGVSDAAFSLPHSHTLTLSSHPSGRMTPAKTVS
ncbi:hypothetical protein P4O66_008529, partial [Electrophorus voltai]